VLGLKSHLIAVIMSRRPVNPSRRLGDGGSIPFVASIQSKSQNSPLISIGLVIVVCFLFFLKDEHQYRNIPRTILKYSLYFRCTFGFYDYFPIAVYLSHNPIYFILYIFPCSLSTHNTINEPNFAKFSGCNSSDWLLLQQFRFVTSLLTLKSVIKLNFFIW